ncbi:pentapeptide repeat-containing protein [Streptomyces sp. NPDC093568]|uniref:pentapeptide repeat-containing protein n=1 Tax=Streptomyces sp. NPDC093568 TaxID=3366041 RepID=UPI0038178B4E
MVTDAERAEHAARLRGLLYLACPDAPAAAIDATAEAIVEHAEEAPQNPVLQAAQLRQPIDVTAQLNLHGADLTGADLTRADLTRADLTRADLTRADLHGADLRGADLTGANLTGADLSGANLDGARLFRTDLTGANLIDLDLTGAYLSGARLIRADLSGTNLSGAELIWADLSGTDLSRADLTNANLTNANLQGARFPSVVNMYLPAGATWDSRTRWPGDLASFVAERSDEVSPGVYRVRGGQNPDRSTVGV